MSAIFGIFYKDGRPVERRDLECMEAVLQGWGQGTLDGGVLWISGSVGLGLRLLHTTPDSLHERQHLALPEGTQLAISADVRLDNREELCGMLGVDTHQQKLMSDRQLILLAYQRWGIDCTERLLGDFSFATMSSVIKEKLKGIGIETGYLE